MASIPLQGTAELVSARVLIGGESGLSTNRKPAIETGQGPELTIWTDIERHIVVHHRSLTVNLNEFVNRFFFQSTIN